MTELVLEFWPIVIAAAAALIWFVRLEGRVQHLNEMLQMLRDEITGLVEMKEHVAEIKSDVKWMKKSLEKLSHNVK